MRKHIVVNYAKRLHEKHSLSLPVDLEKVAREYAQLKYTDIPFEIDGISANLKKKGVKPSIIVNTMKARRRQRFTLAHEIGHVIIPWHMGTIFDITDIASSCAVSYWQMEEEANAFATELLMPTSWLQELIIQDTNLARLTSKIINLADVSALAATLRLRSELPPNYIFIVVNMSNIVTYSGRSNGTYTTSVAIGTSCDIQVEYPHAESVCEFSILSEKYYWIKMPVATPLPSVHYRPWRIVLEQILEEISDNSDQRNLLKRQLNGVLGFANGSLKIEGCYEEKLYASCMQRLSSKRHLEALTSHHDFSEFLTSKVKDIVSKHNADG